VIAEFVVDPRQVKVGGEVTVKWDVQGEVERVTIFKGDEPLVEDARLSDATTDIPDQAGWVTYSITVWWSEGDPISWQEDVQVIESDIEPPIVTESPPAPDENPPKDLTPAPPAVIEYFNALPQQVPFGYCIDLSWKVTGGVVQVQIRRNDLPIPTDGSFTGSGQDCQAPEGTAVYVLEAVNADGVAEYLQAIVEVLPAQAAARLNLAAVQTRVVRCPAVMERMDVDRDSWIWPSG
jgi:hypothetical protein